jgi:hypothetical protein
MFSRYLYVAHPEDPYGVELVDFLKNLSQLSIYNRPVRRFLKDTHISARLLKPNEKAPIGSVAFFTPAPQFRSALLGKRYICASSVRIQRFHRQWKEQLIPSWAQTTPHIKAIQMFPRQKDPSLQRIRFLEAVLNVILEQEAWQWNSDQLQLPWQNGRLQSPIKYPQDLASWVNQVKESLIGF